jgi:hypothetical protein
MLVGKEKRRQADGKANDYKNNNNNNDDNNAECQWFVQYQ